MPRTQIPVDVTSDAGAAFAIDTAADTTNGNYFINSGNELLIVENTGGSSINVTLQFAADPYGRTGTKVVAVPAGSKKVLGKFPKYLYNQAGDQVWVDFSGPCNVCVVRGS